MRPLVVVAGVAGAGKSTVCVLAAKRLGVPFLDADVLHPPNNLMKLASRVPLTDENRWPWLRLVGRALAAAEATGLLIACSALRKRYRDAILREAPTTQFVLLDGPRDLIAKRIEARKDHFMPAGLLASQLAILEPLAMEEPGFTVSLDAPPDSLAAGIAIRLMVSKS